MPLTLVSGEPSQVKKHRQTVLEKHQAESQDPMSVQRLDASELSVEDLVSAVSTLPMFSDTKLVLVGGLAGAVHLQEHIGSIAESIPTSVNVLMSEAGLKKSDALFKQVDEHAEAIFYAPKDKAALADNIVTLAKDLGSNIERGEVVYMINRVGADQARLESDIHKLAAHDDITRDLIDSLTDPLPSSKVFDLLDAAIAGRLEAALDIYEDQRSQKTDPLAILALVIWQLQVIALAGSAKSTDMALLSKESGISEYPLKKAYPVSVRLTHAMLASLVDAAIETDGRIRVDYVDADDAMKLLIIKIANVSRP